MASGFAFFTGFPPQGYGRPLMLIYDRYLLRELLWNFAFTFVTISVIFMIGGAVEIIFKASSLDPVLVIAAIPLVLLSAMVLIIPLSVLVSVVMTYGRVAADGEIITLKSAGVHPYTILSPAMCLAAFAAFATLIINDRLSPQATYQSKNLLKESNILKLLEIQMQQGNRSFDFNEVAITWTREEITKPNSVLETRSLPFLVCGPFLDVGFQSKGPPENKIFDPSETFDDRRWVPARLDRLGRLNAQELLGARHGIYYAVTHLRSARPGWVRFSVDQVDRVALRYDGDWQTWKDGFIDLHLPAGWNEVFLKLDLSDPPRAIAIQPHETEEGVALEVAALANPGSICLFDLMLSMPSEKSDEPTLMVAEVGMINFEAAQRKVSLELRGLRVLKGEAISGERFTIALFFESKGNRIRLKQRTGAELFALLSRLKRQPQNAVPRATVEAQLHDRLVVSSACLIFVLIGMPIAVIFKSANRAVSFVLAFAVVLFFYYPTLILGRSLAEQAAIDPALAMWSGNGLLGLLGTALLIAIVRR